MTSKPYGRCDCRGTLHERRVEVLRRRGRLRMIIQGVPAGVCDQCGLRVFRGPVLAQMERILSRAISRGPRISIPLRRYGMTAG